RTEWQSRGDACVWEGAYAVATHRKRADEADQPIIARILDLETTGRPAEAASPAPRPPPLHTRKVSSLSTYLSSSFGRQQGEALALGTHAGGILRDGEEESVVATRAQLTGCILELVVDASRWHSDRRSVDISMSVRGFASARQLFDSIGEMHSAAPELFTAAQLEMTWDAFRQSQRPTDGEDNDDGTSHRMARTRAADHKLVTALAAMQLVRCYSIRSQKSSRRRYLLRILNPPIMAGNGEHPGSDGESADSTFVAEASDGSTADRVYNVAIAVSRGAAEQESEAGVLVNGHRVEIAPFTLDPAPLGNARSVSVGSGKRVNARRSVSAVAAPKPVPLPTATRSNLLAATPETRTPTPETRGSSLLVSSTPMADMPASEAPTADMTLPDTRASDTRGNSPLSNRASELIPASRRASVVPSISTCSLQAAADTGSGSGDDDDEELHEIPFERLRQASSVAAAKWVSMGTAASGAVAVSRTDLDGMVLRAEAVVEGWTVFDVSALICNVQLTGAVSGLWAEAREIEQIAANASLLRYTSRATWAVAARDAVVCRAWRANARSSRVDIAESSVDIAESSVDEGLADAESADTIRAHVALSAWILDKTNVADAPDERRVRQRSASAATGSPAVDAEVESQRRKQHAVRVTHYLKYSPRGWLALEDSVDMRKLGAMLGIGPRAALLPPIPPPGVRDALVGSVTGLARELDAHGVPPSAVWSRNAQVLGVEAARDHVQFQYRVAAWGAPRRTASMGSSMASRQAPAAGAMPALAGDGEFVEAEFRVEHRVWATGNVAVTIEPFYATSAVACFVDPEADPHATRVRVCHHRMQLLPRVEEAADGVQMAWPTVRVAVARSGSAGADWPCPSHVPDGDPGCPRCATRGAGRQSSSLVRPHVAPWSVPPRIVVNGAPARVRYLRRDEAGRGFYARCMSVAAHEASRLARGPPVAGMFMERMPTPEPQHGHGEPERASCGERLPASSQIAIQNYSVQAGLGANCRVARPGQFADAVQAAFARVRHEIEALDPHSPRSRWMQLRQLDGSDARSLMTAMEEADGWAQRQSGGVAAFERLHAELSAEIPVTVASSVLQGVSVQQAAQALTQRWERQRWDRVLFGERRELEHVGDGVHVEHAAVQVPLLFDRRDALTVTAVEQAPYLPTRQRLRNWQQRGDRDVQGCRAGLQGDYFEPTVTLVEASVPGSQPLSSAVRAHVALYGVRIDPIDGFERARGHAYAYPSCRVTVACCADLAGAVPLALRRSLSARVPEQHAEQLRRRVQQPLWPRLESPSRVRRTAPRRRGRVVGEVLEEDVDGQRMCFYRRFDGALVEHEAVQGGEFVAKVRVPGGIASDVTARVLRLRKDRGASSALAPVVSDVVVDARMFPRGVDVRVQVGSAHSRPIAERCDLDAIPSGAWSVRGLAVFVFALGAAHTAPLAPGTGRAPGASPWLLVRTVLQPGDAPGPDDALEGQVCTVSVQAAKVAGDDRTDAAVVFCNGQRLRVHQARPARQSLLLVHASEGMLAACGECGALGCVDDGAARCADGPALACADDTYASDDDDDQGEGPSAVQRAASVLSNQPLRTLRTLSAGSVQLCAGGQPAIRQRRLAAKSEQPPIAPARADPADLDCLWTRIFALAVFMPVRRLVIGRWALQRRGTPVRSSLALVLVLAVAVACVRLGTAAARLL
ncbi:hypothetical protein GGF43_003205, partial [Coemansia sp. RSA 2618]